MPSFCLRKKRASDRYGGLRSSALVPFNTSKDRQAARAVHSPLLQAPRLLAFLASTRRRGALSTRHSLGRLAVAGPERGGPPARGARQAGRQLRSTAARRSVRAGGDARRLRDCHARPADAVTLALLEALSCPTSPSRSSFVWIPLVWFRSRPTRRRRARPPPPLRGGGATHPGIPRLTF